VGGRIVRRGLPPFPEEALERRTYLLPAEAFVAGKNRIRIENLEPEGPAGNRPWFGVEKVELRLAP